MWSIFSFFNALFNSLKDVTSKKILKKHDKIKFAIIMYFFIALFLLLIFLILKFFPVTLFATINLSSFSITNVTSFLVALIISSLLNTFSIILYLTVLQNYDMSASLPFLSFTPLFLTLTSLIILGEKVSLLGFFGIILIVIGGYSMNLYALVDYNHKPKNNKHNNHPLKKLLIPIKALTKQKGALYMLLISFIWSITSNFDKVGIKSSSLFTWLILINTSFFVCLVLYYHLFYVNKNHKNNYTNKEYTNENYTKQFNNKQFNIKFGLYALLPPFFSSLSLIFQMIAISLTKVAYAIAFKRLSIVFAVIFGKTIFHEKHFFYRIIASLFMFSGVLLIVLAK